MRVGFWRSVHEPSLPVPVENSGVNTDKVLDLVQSLMTPGREDVKRESYRGFSNCRICGIRNGNSEYTWYTNKEIVIFPSGYIHYLKDHNVKIDPKFEQLLTEK